MAGYRKRGKSYSLYWYEGSEKREQSLGQITEKEAKNAKKAKEYELSSGNKLSIYNRTLSQFLPEYLEWFDIEYPSSSERTNQIIEQYLEPEFGHLEMADISIRLADTYKIRRKKEKAKSATIKKELQKLNAILNKAVIWDELDKNPLKGLEYPDELDSKPPRFYTKEELDAIYHHAPNHLNQWKLIVNTGLRRTEALQLKSEHVVGDKLRIHSSNQARTKSGKWREVPLNTAAFDALDSLTSINGFILPRVNPRSLTRAFEKALLRAKKANDIKGALGSIHCLRHTFCSHLVMAGVPLRTVQKLAGHSKIEVTEKYAHLTPEHLKHSTDLISL